MNLLLPIGLLVAGMVLLVIEVFIPSFGVLTLSSVCCLVLALVFGFGESAALGWTLSGVCILGIPTLLIVSFRLFPKTSIGRHMILSGPESHPEPATRSARDDLIGKTGTTLSTLRPSGIAEFGGERLDVITRGEMVDAGTAVLLIETRGNRFIVRQADLPSDETQSKEL